ncbi:MAG: hypothetical protein J6P21_02155 [Clostridia bacterium]|nr:hypothetical protein [Clostridia bacterium]
MHFFKFSKFSKFFSACFSFSFSILLSGFQAHSMDSLNSSFATASGENVDEAFDMFDHIVVPEVCEMCKTNKPFYILAEDQFSSLSSRPLIFCCCDANCVRRFMSSRIRFYSVIPEIINGFKDHGESSRLYISECLSGKCGNIFVNSNHAYSCPKCGCDCVTRYWVDLFDNEDSIKRYRLNIFLLNNLDCSLKKKIFYFIKSGKYGYVTGYNDVWIARALAGAMCEFSYTALKQIYQTLVNGRLVGSQIIKNQVVGGKLENVVLIVKDEVKCRSLEFCEESSLNKKILELSKEGYSIVYGGLLNGNIDSYVYSALKEAGLLGNLFK